MQFYDPSEWKFMCVLYHHGHTLVEHYIHRATGVSGALKRYQWQLQPQLHLQVHSHPHQPQHHNQTHRLNEARREYRLHAKCTRHSGVLPLWFVFETPTCIGIMTAFMERGTLHRAIYYGSHAFRRPCIYQIARSLLPILRTLHRHGFVHRDIKPENIYLGKEPGTYCLGDFGAACEYTTTTTHPPITLRGTIVYMAPELFGPASLKALSTKVDVWALGVTLFEVEYGFKPFHEKEVRQHRTHMIPWPKHSMGTVSRALIESMLTTSSGARPSFDQIREASFPTETDLKGSVHGVASSSASSSCLPPTQVRVLPPSRPTSRKRFWNRLCITC